MMNILNMIIIFETNGQNIPEREFIVVQFNLTL